MNAAIAPVPPENHRGHMATARLMDDAIERAAHIENVGGPGASLERIGAL